jgi:bifunctional NMN adenylyltransferase/nudix hydrolase
MSKKLDVAVLIGRFMPFHNGHLETINYAMTLANKVVIICGSINKARDFEHPFTFAERKSMIFNAIPENLLHKIVVRGVEDTIYNNTKWVTNIQEHVREAIRLEGLDGTNCKIGIVGGVKEEFYMDFFPSWERFVTPATKHNGEVVNATDIRKDYFQSNTYRKILDTHMPKSSVDFLIKFVETPEYETLCKERKHIETYKLSWSVAPYPVTFNTCDAVVIQSGHVLLVKRKHAPGQGLWAIPGGFLDQNERYVDGAIRELREETGLKVPEPVLRGSIRHKEIFDHPKRSLRGRTITVAYLFALAPGELPKVKGQDDAEKAQWIPLSDFYEMRDQMFEDHYDVICTMIDRM